MTEFLLKGLAAIVVLGVFAQWIAWRFRLPSLLLLLLMGFLAGPVLRAKYPDLALSPDILFGEILSPLIALAIAIILFEEGLSFRFTELGKTGTVVRALVSVGALIGWLLTAVAAYLFLDLNLPLSLLLGSIAVISGPSVIVPLLRDMPLKGQLGSIVRFEGVAIEPVGVTLAALVLGGILASEESSSAMMALVGVITTAFVGVCFGTIAALLVLLCLRSGRIPDFLRTPVVLGAVVASFTVANVVQPASGLLATTILGMILANQSGASVRPFAEFHENFRVLALSVLFIVLAARIDVEILREFTFSGIFFVAILIFVVRPVAVLLATAASNLEWSERLFLSFLAPRGFVAAGVSSLFALELIDVGYPQAERLTYVMFLIIILTVSFYGLIAPTIARILGVSDASPHGVLILGAHDWARAIARELQNAGFRLLLVDSNQYNILAARREGVPARSGNVFQDDTLDEIVLDGFARFFALTSNDEVNTLAALHFGDYFGKDHVFQLPSADKAMPTEVATDSLEKFRNGILFGKSFSFDTVEDRTAQGAAIVTVESPENASPGELERVCGADVVPLFAITKGGELLVSTIDRSIVAVPGGKLICLVNRDAAEKIRKNSKLVPLDRGA